MSSYHKPMRLPPLKALKVQNPNTKPQNPCITIMSSMLACWASAGYNTAGCAALEQQLRKCMDAPPTTPPPKSMINAHLARMQDRVTTARKYK